MKSPKFYRGQIDSLGIEELEIDVSSLEMAMETMHKLSDIENIMKKIRYNLRSSVRRIRLDYMRRIQEVDEEAKKPGLFGRKKSPNKIIHKKKALIKDRERDIAAYALIENMIDGYLSEIEDSKVYIQDSIQRRVE